MFVASSLSPTPGFGAENQGNEGYLSENSL